MLVSDHFRATWRAMPGATLWAGAPGIEPRRSIAIALHYCPLLVVMPEGKKRHRMDTPYAENAA
jgi:hypothetical protein